MGQPKLIPSTNVTSLRVARGVKGEVNYQGLAKAENYRAGTVEPPLPLTPQRLELIKKYLNDHLRRAEEPTATRIPESVAPRAQAVSPADAATLTGSILAFITHSYASRSSSHRRAVTQLSRRSTPLAHRD
jgi:hypothetical protein